MTNSEKFQKVFGFYATEMWAKPEKEFLEWINSEALEYESGDDLISRADAVKRLTEEDKFSRRFACWANNHHGWSKAKKQNRRIAKRRLKREEDFEEDDE